MNVSNFSVPPPFADVKASATFVVPEGFSCVRWDSTGQIVVSCLGGSMFGVMMTLIMRYVVDPTRKIARKISWKLPSDDPVNPSAPPMPETPFHV